MSERIDIFRIFIPLKRLELALFELYSWYSERFSSDEVAALVFKRLALDEKAHAALIDYQKKLVQKNPKEFVEVVVDVVQVVKMAEKAESLRRADCPDIRSAVLVAIDFESSAAEYHCRNAIIQSKPSIAKLMECLGKTDRFHHEELLGFARSRGYIPG